MLVLFLACMISAGRLHAQAGQLFYDVTTQPTASWLSGAVAASTTCNIGQLVLNLATPALELTDNSGSVVSQLALNAQIIPSNADGHTLTSNHNSCIVWVSTISTAGTINLALYSNVPANGQINMAGNIFTAQDHGHYNAFLVSSTCGCQSWIGNAQAAMDDANNLYITFELNRSGHSTPSNELWYYVFSFANNNFNWVSGGPIPRPGDLIPATGAGQPTITCNRWNNGTGTATIGYIAPDPNTGRPRPAQIVVGPNTIGSPGWLPEPNMTPITPCLWVRAINSDNPYSTPFVHYFYAYAPQPPGGPHLNNTLWSTDNSTVSTVISPNLVLSPSSDGVTTLADPAVGDGYIAAIPNQAATVYCAFVENSSGMQNLRITREFGNNNSIVQTNPIYNWYSLGCNQMGVFIAFGNSSGNRMWRAFRPFYGDIMENTVASGLCKVDPNSNSAVQGIGVGTAARLTAGISDTLRVFEESNITPAQLFQFTNSNPITTPPVLWAGEHPSSNIDADPGNARGEIILDLGSNVDFGGELTPPLLGAIFQARSDGQIDYNGAIFGNEKSDLIGCVGETRVSDLSTNRRGIFNINYPLSFNVASPPQSSPVSNTGGIYGGSIFGGVKGLVNFICSEGFPYWYYMTISGQGLGMNFDQTYMYLGQPIDPGGGQYQIGALDAGDGNGPPNSIIFTNGIISNLHQPNGWTGGSGQFVPDIGPGYSPNLYQYNVAFDAWCPLYNVANINISNNIILYTNFTLYYTDDNIGGAGDPAVLVNLNNNKTEDIAYAGEAAASSGNIDDYGNSLFLLQWLAYNSQGYLAQFQGQINILGNQMMGDWPENGSTMSDPSETIILDGWSVPVNQQWRVKCDDNIFDNRSTGDGSYVPNYNSNSIAVLLNDGAEVDVSNNTINGYGYGIVNEIQNNAYSFYCNNTITQAGQSTPNGIGILEEGGQGSVYPKLNVTSNLSIGYEVTGTNQSTPVANQFNNCTIGAEFGGFAHTILNGSHTGADNFAGFNQFENNTQAQVVLVDNGIQSAQPLFGLPNAPGCTQQITGIFGENIFALPSSPNTALHFQSLNSYTLNGSITENQWSPNIQSNNVCTNTASPDPKMNNIAYFNIGNGSATGSFTCGTDGNGNHYKTKQGKMGSLSNLNNNPVPPSDSEWLYYEAQQWISVNNQFALDTMRLFVEQHPMDRTLIPSALGYTDQIVALIADSGVYIVTQDWIDEYNWLASVYASDTAAWYESNVLLAMADAENYFNLNEDANLYWNISRLFPFAYSTDSTEISFIRNFQHERNLDTTPFHVIQIPPVPYGSSYVTPSLAQNTTLSVAPNPANQTLTAYITTTFSAPATLEIYDALGQRVMALPSPRLQMGNNQFNFDCSTLAAGNYFLRLSTGETVQTVRIAIEH